jgi:hypothetical protein
MTLKPSARVRPIVGTLALLAALIVLPLALAPRAEAFVYWADPSKGAIGRANLDGTGVDKRFIRRIESPVSVAVDGRYIYWTTPTPAAIARARLDGTKVDETFIAFSGSGTTIGQIAVDDDHIYWTAGCCRSHPPDPVSASIGRANLDGTDVDPSFITGFDRFAGPTGVAVDANHIYWSQFGSQTQTAAIARANLDGTGIDRTFIPFSGDAAYPGAVEVDAAHIYWINAQVTYPGATIGRANLDGTGVDPSFAPGPGLGTSVTDVAADAGHIYWTQVPGDDPNTGAIARAQLDGANLDQDFITPAPPARPYGIAVNFSLGKLKKANDKGTARLTVEVPAPGGIALAQTTKVNGAEVRAEAAGELQLAIKPTGRAKKKLAHKGKAKVEVEVTYTPDGGQPSTQSTALKLKRG